MALAAAAALAVAAWAVIDLVAARAGYLGMALFHGTSNWQRSRCGR